MSKTTPHDEAKYRVISLPSGSFGVEVIIPGSYPTTISSFATEAHAEGWIAKHKSRVEAQNAGTGWFRNRGSRTNPSAKT